MQVTFTAMFMEFLFWTADYLFGKRNKHVGSHRAEALEPVPPDWHPLPEEIMHKGLWWARMHHRPITDFLHVPLEVLVIVVELANEISKIKQLSNYAWADVPTGEWPTVWRDMGLI